MVEAIPQNACLSIPDPCQACICGCKEHEPENECTATTRCASS
ncbi:7521_t:CDS:1, partial [Dentiscutata erythropus]